MDNAYNDVESKASLEKEKYTFDNLYDNADVCNTDGADCKAGDKAAEDRATSKTAIKDLTDNIATYETKRTDYTTAFDT